MQRTKPTNGGFTLVEVLVIAPITMIVLATFVYIMSTLVGEVLVQRERNMMTYSLQDATDKLENDIKLAVAFPAATNTLPSPQGVGGTTAPFNSDKALILTTLGTTKRPPDASRELSFSKDPDAGACGSLLQYRNNIVPVTVVYFLDGGKLWRRTIVPDYPAPCAGLQPWQQNSCPQGKTGAVCKTTDILITDGVSAMALSYAAVAGGTTTTTASSATTIATVRLTASKRVAGRDLSVTNAVTAMKLNY